MISCILSGGLGNQLFQIFTTIAYCIQHNTTYVFSKTKMTKRDPRPLYWTSFLSAISSNNLIDSDEFIKTENNWNTYTDPKHTYTPIPENDGNMLLSGAFQSYRYFNQYKTQIMDSLCVSPHQQRIKQHYFQTPIAPITISMHFRMGDYKRLRCYHPILPWEYYVSALGHILERCKNNSLKKQPMKIVYYFFEQEDIHLINQYMSHIQKSHPYCFYIPVTHISSDWEEMLAMSCCDHHILANSTFSWWGAYLHNTTSNIELPVVCYPSVWYGHQLYYIDITDLCPPSWTKIQINTKVICNCDGV